jgi:hypothetical protein
MEEETLHVTYEVVKDDPWTHQARLLIVDTETQKTKYIPRPFETGNLREGLWTYKSDIGMKNVMFPNIVIDAETVSNHSRYLCLLNLDKDKSYNLMVLHGVTPKFETDPFCRELAMVLRNELQPFQSGVLLLKQLEKAQISKNTRVLVIPWGSNDYGNCRDLIKAKLWPDWAFYFGPDSLEEKFVFDNKAKMVDFVYGLNKQELLPKNTRVYRAVQFRNHTKSQLLKELQDQFQISEKEKEEEKKDKTPKWVCKVAYMSYGEGVKMFSTLNKLVNHMMYLLICGDDLVVQETVPGKYEYAYHLMCLKGVIIHSVVIRHGFSTKELFVMGENCVSETRDLVAANPALIKEFEKLAIANNKYTGILCIDLKLNPKDENKPQIFEINVRLGGSLVYREGLLRSALKTVVQAMVTTKKEEEEKEIDV